MYSEDDLLPLSALQHLVFCPRQCALIHIERLWQENWFTAQGRVLHERVHEQKTERRKNVRIEFGLELRSYQLGLIGKADVVEFHCDEEKKKWQPFPVEYKRGKPKPDNCDAVQLCAQAMCLEEMMELHVLKGAIFYGKEQRRTEIAFDQSLRNQTMETAQRLHALIRSGKTPPPVYEPKCDACSLLEVCLPKTIQKKAAVDRYLFRMVNES